MQANPFLSIPAHECTKAVAKAAHVVPFGSPEGYRPPRDISPLCLIIRRQPDGERAPYRLHLSTSLPPLPSTPFELFRRLISCLVEDVVVAISFASRGAWATSSMKWTTCLSYRIWLTMEWGEGVILLWTLFFLFFFWGEGGGEGKWSIFQGKLKIWSGKKEEVDLFIFHSSLI